MKSINNLYKGAKEIKFELGDNLVFISDIHKGDGTFYDSFLSNANIYKTALSYYYRKAFVYVEVGDGDELWKNRTFTDIAYNYIDVFKVLNKFKKENRIYMIYGNHDIIKKRENFYNNQVKVFKKDKSEYCKEFLNFIKDLPFYEGLKFNFQPVDEDFLVAHGHQVDPMNNKYWIVSRFLIRYVWKFLYGLAGFKDPTSPAKNNTKGNKVDRKLGKWAKDNNRMLICGHTHNSRMPSIDEVPYFNDGCCVLPNAMTAIEIESGNVFLVKWSIEAQESGALWVRRKIITGPEDLSKYLLKAKDDRIKKALRDAEIKEETRKEKDKLKYKLNIKNKNKNK
ncbi:metallophosphoesterase [Clostridium sp.]|uniref:metallophosphoesterase n=1 Tax=Clostridium sp. TaxID=1506 RepID=UPI002635A031|nr:metallophosphoesterase [Clostridium sp.]